MMFSHVFRKPFAEHLLDAYPWVKCEEQRKAQDMGSALKRAHSVMGEKERQVQIFTLNFLKLEFAPAFSLSHRGKRNEHTIKRVCIISSSKIVEHIFVWCSTAYKTHSQH